MAILFGWLLIFALVAPAPAGASPAHESDFVSRVNATRASVGLPPLTVDPQLTSLARSWAVQMRDGVCGEGNHICHVSSLSSGVTHSWQKLGENVGTGPSVADVMPAFIASPGHYQNIVDPTFTHIGVGVVWDGNRLYTTHRFMAVSAPAPTTTTTTTAAPTTTTAAAPTTTAAAPTPAIAALPPTGALPAPRTTPTASTPVPRSQPSAFQTPPPESGSEPSTPTDDVYVPELTPFGLEVREQRAGVLVTALTQLD